MSHVFKMADEDEIYLVSPILYKVITISLRDEFQKPLSRQILSRALPLIFFLSRLYLFLRFLKSVVASSPVRGQLIEEKTCILQSILRFKRLSV